MRRSTVPALFCSICIPPTVSGAWVFCPALVRANRSTSSAIFSAELNDVISAPAIVGMLNVAERLVHGRHVGAILHHHQLAGKSPHPHWPAPAHHGGPTTCGQPTGQRCPSGCARHRQHPLGHGDLHGHAPYRRTRRGGAATPSRHRGTHPESSGLMAALMTRQFTMVMMTLADTSAILGQSPSPRPPPSPRARPCRRSTRCQRHQSRLVLAMGLAYPAPSDSGTLRPSSSALSIWSVEVAAHLHGSRNLAGNRVALHRVRAIRGCSRHRLGRVKFHGSGARLRHDSLLDA